MNVLLVSAYELGHQPLAVAEPAGVLRARGHDVRCVDLSVEPWDPALAAWADRIALSVPTAMISAFIYLPRRCPRAARGSLAGGRKAHKNYAKSPMSRCGLQ